MSTLSNTRSARYFAPLKPIDALLADGGIVDQERRASEVGVLPAGIQPVRFRHRVDRDAVVLQLVEARDVDVRELHDLDPLQLIRQVLVRKRERPHLVAAISRDVHILAGDAEQSGDLPLAEVQLAGDLLLLDAICSGYAPDILLDFLDQLSERHAAAPWLPCIIEPTSSAE